MKNFTESGCEEIINGLFYSTLSTNYDYLGQYPTKFYSPKKTPWNKAAKSIQKRNSLSEVFTLDLRQAYFIANTESYMDFLEINCWNFGAKMAVYVIFT